MHRRLTEQMGFGILITISFRSNSWMCLWDVSMTRHVSLPGATECWLIIIFFDLPLQLCLTLSNPVDCSPPGSSVHRIFHEMEWVAISSSRGSSWPRDWTHFLHLGRFFTAEPPGNLLLWLLLLLITTDPGRDLKMQNFDFYYCFTD